MQNQQQQQHICEMSSLPYVGLGKACSSTQAPRTNPRDREEEHDAAEKQHRCVCDALQGCHERVHLVDVVRQPAPDLASIGAVKELDLQAR